MNLSIEEKTILIIYQLLFDKNYTPSKNISKHMDIQAALHLCNELRIPLMEDYRFHWSKMGPISSDVESTLEKLNAKSNQIKDFYQKQDIDSSQIFSDFHINQLLMLKFFIQSEEEPNFINILSCLAYMYYPACIAQLESALKELQKRGIDTDNDELFQNAWGYLSIMKINNENVDEDIKVLRRVVKSTIKKQRHQ